MILEKMNHRTTRLTVYSIGILTLTLILCFHNVMKSFASGDHGLSLSDMHIRITSKEHMATFQLYDIAAARELYEQLPLKLELSNFRDAQWMFYPPKKLKVTSREAYHDGKKGELSYYAPWGDVFMLYKDFYAGDEMHRLGVGISGIDEIEAMSGTVQIERN